MQKYQRFVLETLRKGFIVPFPTRSVSHSMTGFPGLFKLIDKPDKEAVVPKAKRLDIIQRFEDPNWPEADLFVVQTKLDKRDPRHPNPAAGVINLYFVEEASTAKRQQYKSVTLAVDAARVRHRAAIDKLNTEKSVRAEAIRQEEEKNLRQLENLPNYGGF